MSFTIATAYTHTQAVAASTWTVQHNLGQVFPIVDVYIMSEGEILITYPSDITYTDANTVVIQFTLPQTGFVRCI